MERLALDRARLAACIETCRRWTALVVTDQTGSTNADLVEAAKAGAPIGSVHTTDHQAAGRGRLDRGFEQPKMSGLAVSVLLRPTVDMTLWSWLPLVAGLAVVDTIEASHVECELKWPNDVLIDGLKVCGILAELVNTSDGPAVVAGIGINVDQRGSELPTATSTSMALAGAVGVNRSSLLLRLLDNLASRLDQWEEDPDSIRTAYERRCATVGRRVKLELPGGRELIGVVDGIDETGAVIVDGQAFVAGDVTHLRSA